MFLNKLLLHGWVHRRLFGHVKLPQLVAVPVIGISTFTLHKNSHIKESPTISKWHGYLCNTNHNCKTEKMEWNTYEACLTDLWATSCPCNVILKNVCAYTCILNYGSQSKIREISTIIWSSYEINRTAMQSHVNIITTPSILITQICVSVDLDHIPCSCLFYTSWSRYNISHNNLKVYDSVDTS